MYSVYLIIIFLMIDLTFASIDKCKLNDVEYVDAHRLFITYEKKQG